MDLTTSRGFSWARRATGSSTGPCLDIENLLDPELKKRLGEPLERPLRAARPQSPHEAQLMSELYARIAQKCGKPLLDEVAGPNSHERFDASLENATRVFEAIVTEELAQQDATFSKDVQRIGTVDDFMESTDINQPRPLGRSISTTSSDHMLMVMDKVQLRKALEQQGFQELENSLEFHQLWDAINNNGSLDLKSFHAVLRHLKLYLLCGGMRWTSAATGTVAPQLPEESGFIGFIDWNQRRIDEFYFRRPDRPMDFFLTHRKAQMKMRWVHCARVGRPTILRLAVKYQLHPLPVEDLIQLEQQSVPLVRKYNEKFFVVIPLLRLTSEAKRKLSQYRELRSRRISDVQAEAEDIFTAPELEHCRFACFAAGPPHYDTVISFMTEWKKCQLHGESEHAETGRVRSSSDDAPGRTQMDLSPLPLLSPSMPSPSMTLGEAERQETGDEQDFFAGVVRQIQRDYSMLRAGNASWILWRLVDVTIDELSPILSAYRAQLRWFSSLITTQEARVSKDVEKRLLRSKVELDWVQRKVRPILKVLKHLIKDKAIDPDVTRYLEDVEDHLNLFLEEVSRIIGVCNSLRDEVNSYRDRQQQKVLYVLTLVTTLVMPTHLLTGIFGMNWQDEAGQPVVPGFGVMAEKRGYYLFWGTSITFTFVIWTTFRRILKWI